jgi:hypothetical protein
MPRRDYMQPRTPEDRRPSRDYMSRSDPEPNGHVGEPAAAGVPVARRRLPRRRNLIARGDGTNGANGARQLSDEVPGGPASSLVASSSGTAGTAVAVGRRAFYYGYWLVMVAFIAQFVAVGSQNYVVGSLLTWGGRAPSSSCRARLASS